MRSQNIPRLLLLPITETLSITGIGCSFSSDVKVDKLTVIKKNSVCFYTILHLRELFQDFINYMYKRSPIKISRILIQPALTSSGKYQNTMIMYMHNIIRVYLYVNVAFLLLIGSQCQCAIFRGTNEKKFIHAFSYVTLSLHLFNYFVQFSNFTDFAYQINLYFLSVVMFHLQNASDILFFCLSKM